MNCHKLNLIILIWELVNFSGIVSEKTCALNKLFTCLNGETCKQVSNLTSFGVCDCKKKYKRVTPGGDCIKIAETGISFSDSTIAVNSSTSTGSAIIGGLIIVVLLASLIIGLVFAERKYKWLRSLREKAQQLMPRNRYPVLVSQEDDPPLA